MNRYVTLNIKWQLLFEEVNKSKQNMCVIPRNSELLRLLIAGEDHRFKFHSGVDVIALIRASWKTLILKQREGGSTIAMQLVRVLTGKNDKTIDRKLEEMFLAYKLTKYVSKQEILSLYLSVAYFGWNMHGISQACKVLKLNLHNLTLEESASLIARLKYPEPKNFLEQRNNQIKNRTKYILKRYNTLKIKDRYASF
ncbi:biosynthetic peptidoglycan transglycosylase [Wolinella succinogenes]|uniref:biosynthetic peptidoglycan transglycosylase n=1 Tax=Wolinella succinogenes TaxID=844 RepID=UPI002FC66FA7